MSLAITILIALVIFAVFWLLLYVVVRAAVVGAIRSAGANLSTVSSLMSSQVELTHRLAKHLIAQSELMLVTAKHDGITDDQLAGVMKQLEERKAEPAPAFFENPYT